MTQITRLPKNRSRRIVKKLMKRSAEYHPVIDAWITKDKRIVTGMELLRAERI